ncbi:VWA domain-containing protein [Segatella copri]|uniref:VWA domain-containing protein n=1 Tax=Segatella copri TaxID=165179 RepID=A0AA92TJ42_9BACT|nr:VWA domain-containing protein [Segatella copri]
MDNKHDENFEQKCLCVLVLDTSYSMDDGSIDELNAGLKRFQDELLKDKTTRDRLEVAIVTFDSDVKTIQQPALLTDFSMPTLECNGSTCMIDGISEAIDIVENRKQYYKSHGIPYYRPWIVMMTDGYPDSDQDVDGMSSRIKDAHQHKEFVFMGVGVGDSISEDVLKQLAQSDFPPMKMQAVKFCEFFTWLSNSMSGVSNSTGTDVTIPNPTEWLHEMI